MSENEHGEDRLGELAEKVVATLVRQLRPAFEAEGMPDPETAFDDLPVFDPREES